MNMPLLRLLYISKCLGIMLMLSVLLLAGCDTFGVSTIPSPTPVSYTQTPITSGITPSPTSRSETLGSAGGKTATPLEASSFVNVSPTPTLLPETDRAKILEGVTDSVRDNYLYPDYNGVDWNAIRDKYWPLAMAADSNEGFYKAISDMILKLDDDHSRFLSPTEAIEEDNHAAGHVNYVGVGVSTQPDKDSELVLYVFPGSPAEKAGIARRDRIFAVDGVPYVDAEKEPLRIRGPAGTTVRLTIKSPEQPLRDVTVERRLITGKVIPSSRQLNDHPNIAYVLISELWTEDMDQQTEVQLKELISSGEPLEGLIIDLRGNRGGLGTVLTGILGQFTTGVVGRPLRPNYSHSGSLNVTKGNLYDSLKSVPLVILVDKGTESNAEILAAVLQSQGRALIVGTPSAGNTEGLSSYNFADGSRLMLATKAFELPDGTNLEGRGVIPDVHIDADWTNYTEQNDPYITEAVKLLQGANEP